MPDRLIAGVEMLIKKQSASKNHFQPFSPVNYFTGVFLLVFGLFALAFILNSIGYAYSAIFSLFSSSASSISFYSFISNIIIGIQTLANIALFVIALFVFVVFVVWTCEPFEKMGRLAIEKYKMLTKRKN